MRSALNAGRHRAAKVIVLSLLAAVLVCAAAMLSGCGGGQATKAKIGEPASNSKVEVTVNSVKTLGEITMEDGGISTVRGNGVFIVVDMTVKNLQQRAHYVDLSNLRLSGGQTRWRAEEGFADDPHAPVAFRPLRTGRLGPGKKVRGMVLFMIDQGTLDTLTYSADSKDVVIGLEGLKAKTPSATPVPRVGHTAKAGGLAMTVHSVTYPTMLAYGLNTLSPRPGDKLVVIDVALKNVGRKPTYRIDPLGLRIVDAKKMSWLPYNRKQSALPESAQLPVKRLKLGAQARGKVVISVPANRQLKRIRYAVGVLGPPLEVRLTG